eukprot:Nk52_evm1s1351 gene=Nk52_evmTU1s1351
MDGQHEGQESSVGMNQDSVNLIQNQNPLQEQPHENNQDEQPQHQLSTEESNTVEEMEQSLVETQSDGQVTTEGTGRTTRNSSKSSNQVTAKVAQEWFLDLDGQSMGLIRDYWKAKSDLEFAQFLVSNLEIQEGNI